MADVNEVQRLAALRRAIRDASISVEATCAGRQAEAPGDKLGRTMAFIRAAESHSTHAISAAIERHPHLCTSVPNPYD
eukprot:7274296-Pyramimonas_sp.AAC.1